MKYRLKTSEGKKLYAKRKSTVETNLVQKRFLSQGKGTGSAMKSILISNEWKPYLASSRLLQDSVNSSLEG